jgi:hypothetical protein
MHNTEIYIIYSPGRTGSHIILEAISESPDTPGGLCNALKYWEPGSEKPYSEYNTTQNIAIHTHTLNDTIKNLDVDTCNVTLILSQRRDQFAQIMSNSISEITGEWHGSEYSNKSPIPQVVPKSIFLKHIEYHKNWQSNLKYLPFEQYKKVITIYYEDIVNYGVEHLAQMLNVRYDSTVTGKIFNKSPYNYKDWILNWQELHKEFLRNH